MRLKKTANLKIAHLKDSESTGLQSQIDAKTIIKFHRRMGFL